MAKTKLSQQALASVAARFRVLGEPNRLLLIQTLRESEKPVNELVRLTGLTQANVSKHLATLTESGILGRRKEGVSVIYFIADPSIFDLCELVCGSLQRRLETSQSMLKHALLTDAYLSTNQSYNQLLVEEPEEITKKSDTPAGEPPAQPFSIRFD